MILHLFDDEKFVDIAIGQFEAVDKGNNVYFIAIKSPNKSPKYSKLRGENILSDRVDSKTYQDLISRINDFSAVVLHCFVRGYKSELVAGSDKNIHFHWMSWGIDIYSNPLLEDKTFLPATAQFLNQTATFSKKIKRIFRKRLPIVHKVILSAYRIIKPEFDTFYLIDKKIKSVSTVIPSDYELVKKYISTDIEYIPFKYGSIEDFLNGNVDTVCKGDNFLVGNSATPTNNHLEAFEHLKDMKISGVKIYCPLSYGHSNYFEHIMNQGKTSFGNDFYPLVDFIPLSEYNQILNSCGNVVMNHLRQQAMGNIIMTLWKGARLFLHEDNPVYTYFNDCGVLVYKLSDISRLSELPDSETIATHNRPILMKIYGRENVELETARLSGFLEQ